MKLLRIVFSSPTREAGRTAPSVKGPNGPAYARRAREGGDRQEMMGNPRSATRSRGGPGPNTY